MKSDCALDDHERKAISLEGYRGHAATVATPDRRGHGAIWLKVNGEMRQEGDLNQLIWKVPEMVSCLSGLFTFAPGGLILSGTSSGVGPVHRGDALHGHIDGVGDLALKVI